jgi:hypothetical protein
MSLSFVNDNEVIVYVAEKILSYRQWYQILLAADCVWWLGTLIGLEQGLIIHIENLHYWIKDNTKLHGLLSGAINTHAGRQCEVDNSKSSTSEIGQHDIILDNWEEFLLESEATRGEFYIKSRNSRRTDLAAVRAKESFGI